MSLPRREVISVGIAIVAMAPGNRSWALEAPMSEGETRRNKAIIADFIERVWRQGLLNELPAFWTDDCVNHADPGPANRGLIELRRYHQRFSQAFEGFSSPSIEIVQQVAERDRVVTQLVTHATHLASGKAVSLATIRIDRLSGGRIAEHWSVADMAGLMQQISS